MGVKVVLIRTGLEDVTACFVNNNDVYSTGDSDSTTGHSSALLRPSVIAFFWATVQ